MSRGQFQPKTHSERVLERCKNRDNPDKVVIFDVDKGELDYVIVDAPVSSNQRPRSSRTVRQEGQSSFNTVIRIDDDESNDGYDNKNAEIDATSRTFCPASSSSCIFEDDDDECVMFVGKGKAPELSKTKDGNSKNRTAFRNFDFSSASDSGTSARHSSDPETCENHISEGSSLANDLSESDSSDCEIMDDSSGNIREEWEKAASKKHMQDRAQSSGEHVNAVGSDGDSQSPLCETTHDKANVEDDACNTFFHSKQFENAPGNSYPNACNGENLQNAPDMYKEDSFARQKQSSVTYSDDIDAQDSHNCHANEELNSRMPSMHGRADFHFQDASMEDNRELRGDKYFNDHEAKILGNEVPRESSFYSSEIGEKPKGEEKGNLENPSVSTQQFDAAKLQGGASLQDMEMKEDLSSENVILGQKDSHLTNERVNFQYNSYPTSREPFKCAQDGEQKKLVETATTAPSSDSFNVSVNFVPNTLIGLREKHKESDEYKRAQEEEWASRQEQLRLQGEEAQRLRRRKRAESLRLLDMEKRQKQRIEEVRESQKKDEETINLKEKFRAEVRKELDKMELMHRDMASLLHGLGIPVGGGRFPSSHEVNAAYKRALLRFHPDRASRTDIRQQVEAEEKFKLISRLKEKLQRLEY